MAAVVTAGGPAVRLSRHREGHAHRVRASGEYKSVPPLALGFFSCSGYSA